MTIKWTIDFTFSLTYSLILLTFSTKHSEKGYEGWVLCKCWHGEVDSDQHNAFVLLK